MTEKIIPSVMRRGLLGVGFSYLISLTLPLISYHQGLSLGLCLLLLLANQTMFLAICALPQTDAKKFFLWSARLHFLSFLLTALTVAHAPCSPQLWLNWGWLVAPTWWLSHILASASLYLVYAEFRPGGPAWLPLLAPIAAGVLLLNPFGWSTLAVLLLCLGLAAIQAQLYFWCAVAGPNR